MLMVPQALSHGLWPAGTDQIDGAQFTGTGTPIYAVLLLTVLLSVVTVATLDDGMKYYDLAVLRLVN